MKKYDVFTFTAPNGVKVTAVVVDVLEPITEHTFDETSVITKHLCYAQNRLFYYDVVDSIKKVIDEYLEVSEYMDYDYALKYHSHEVRSSEGHLNEIIVEYCVLPEYDIILESTPILNKEQIKTLNDVISSVVCYAAGEFTESQFENRMRDLKQPEEVIEHTKTVVELTNAHFDEEEENILFS